MEIKETYTIAKYNLPYLTKKVEKLNKRASKMGMETISVNVIREFVEFVEFTKFNDHEYHLDMVEVSVNGNAPKFDGWSFLATIEHDKVKANLIKTIPGIELDPKYREVGSNCDHCHVNRYRKKTFVCRHEDGREVQVGSTCIKDFLGHRSPQSIAWMCEALGDFRAFLEGECSEIDYDKVPRAEMFIDIKRFLVATACEIQSYGWVSRSKARYDDTVAATAEGVENSLFPAPRYTPPKPNADDYKMAYGALEWVRSLSAKSNLSDYEHNISSIAKGGYVPVSEFGLAVSIVGVYKTMKDKERANKKAFLNEYFGEIKKRYDLDLTVNSVSVTDGYYGPTTIYKMSDAEGHRFCWFSSSSKIDLKKGDTYKLKGTVKKHTEWNGMKETALTRVAYQK